MFQAIGDSMMDASLFMSCVKAIKTITLPNYKILLQLYICKSMINEQYVLLSCPRPLVVAGFVNPMDAFVAKAGDCGVPT